MFGSNERWSVFTGSPSWLAFSTTTTKENFESQQKRPEFGTIWLTVTEQFGSICWASQKAEVQITMKRTIANSLSRKIFAKHHHIHAQKHHVFTIQSKSSYFGLFPSGSSVSSARASGNTAVPLTTSMGMIRSVRSDICMLDSRSASGLVPSSISDRHRSSASTTWRALSWVKHIGGVSVMTFLSGPSLGTMIFSSFILREKETFSNARCRRQDVISNTSKNKNKRPRSS